MSSRLYVFVVALAFVSSLVFELPYQTVGASPLRKKDGHFDCTI